MESKLQGIAYIALVLAFVALMVSFSNYTKIQELKSRING